MAFDMSERDRLGLRGLIPPAVRTLEDQILRTIDHLRSQPNDVAKNLFLQELHNRNETLYHRILVDYMEEVAPLVYTPTVGTVCQEFGHRFSRSRGMYFSLDDRGKFSTMLHNWPHDNVHVIVVTDGSRILGLGDLGVHGMGIPIGKLALYCAAGGIAAASGAAGVSGRGHQQPVPAAAQGLCGAAQEPHTGRGVLRVHGRVHAGGVRPLAAGGGAVRGLRVQQGRAAAGAVPPQVPLLQRRHTGHGLRDSGRGPVRLPSGGAEPHRHAGAVCGGGVCGPGGAALGVCGAIKDGMIRAGLSEKEAQARFVICNNNGALGRSGGVFGDPNHAQGLFADPAVAGWACEHWDGTPLQQVLEAFRPTVLLGLSAQPNLFNEELIRTMASQCERPIIMPMSNPTSRCECSAEQAYRWTEGRAIVATGSPFQPVRLGGTDGRTLTPSQCNNMYVFPGLGLAASAGGITTFTDQMLYEAAVACVNSMTEEERLEGRTFPSVKRIRQVSLAVACAVIREGMRAGLTDKMKILKAEGNIEQYVSRKMYFPDYVPLL
eukprot:CAMPEP_0201113342 /NCGR_PEP_ID=MMETSP0812-20130820/77795_1 /ASSEMBLY_ACC=CAM_ASM_000668 /TAXON_ID=98059 /ORGANISM="Dinobryon sp., Strain UTEXLB2267" /LENGTH=546 /DNA_ID=CAMNT_0047376867 /DNA_START=1427 /DNA_END=3065 /DNA_ORIENTATION=+